VYEDNVKTAPMSHLNVQHIQIIEHVERLVEGNI